MLRLRQLVPLKKDLEALEAITETKTRFHDHSPRHSEKKEATTPSPKKGKPNVHSDLHSETDTNSINNKFGIGEKGIFEEKVV